MIRKKSHRIIQKMEQSTLIQCHHSKGTRENSYQPLHFQLLKNCQTEILVRKSWSKNAKIMAEYPKFGKN